MLWRVNSPEQIARFSNITVIKVFSTFPKTNKTAVESRLQDPNKRWRFSNDLSAALDDSKAFEDTITLLDCLRPGWYVKTQQQMVPQLVVARTLADTLEQ